MTPKLHPTGKPAGPKLHPVDSKMIKAMGWAPSSPKADKGTLHVQFRDGTVFEYTAVENDQWKLFHGSPSKGHFFHSSIKPHYVGCKRGGG